jgi:multidrug efflux pump subunit AcrA (membrane-fusion protein)
VNEANRSRKIRACLTVFCLALAASGCGDGEQQSPAYRASKTVRVGYSRSQVVRPALDTFGTLVYHSKADIYPGIDGTVEKILVEEGQRVAKGQTLVLFSKDRLLTSREQFEAEVASKKALLKLAEEKLREGRNTVEARILEIKKAEAGLRQTQAEFDNISQIYSNKKRLFEAGGISEGELQALHTRFIAAQMELSRAEKDLEIRRIGFRDQDILAAGCDVPTDEQQRLQLLRRINTGMLDAERRVAQAELGAAEAELRRITLMLGDTAVQAPIDGIVGMRFVEVGEKAGRDTLLLTLFNTDTVFAQVEVAEADLRNLKVGQEAELLFEGKDESKERGQVELISPYIDPKARTARVRVHMDNSMGAYIPGMFARIRIFVGDAEEQVTVPQRAIVTNAETLSAGKAIVFLVRNSRVFRREVDQGQREGDRVVVLSGLEPGEALVLDAAPGMRDGTEVEVLP